ncbi:hypothetical protein BKA93DRAFT_809336 [Sparassis latifolia]
MPENNKREFDLYKPFVDCVEDAKLCPGRTLRLVQNKADPDDPSRSMLLFFERQTTFLGTIGHIGHFSSCP